MSVLTNSDARLLDRIGGHPPFVREVTAALVDERARLLRQVAGWLEELADDVGDLVGLAYLDGLADATEYADVDAYDDARASRTTEERAHACDVVRQLADEFRGDAIRQETIAASVGPRPLDDVDIALGDA